MNHDRLFNELLTSFFYEFIELFFPSLADLIDRSHPPVFLDKESFGELPGDKTREQDLVARVRTLEGEAGFIVHTEHEAQNTSHFPARMHMYFARSLERYGPPIYPIAIFSKRSRRPRQGRYHLRFHDLEVLDFRYLTLELAELDWRKFVDRANPVASALMARMKIRREDRPNCTNSNRQKRHPIRSALFSQAQRNYAPVLALAWSASRFNCRAFLTAAPGSTRPAPPRIPGVSLRPSADSIRTCLT